MDAFRMIPGARWLWKAGAFCSLTLSCLICHLAFAQQPASVRRMKSVADCPTTPLLDPVVDRSPRPAAELASFVKDVSSNDARFDLYVGQGRLLTLQADLVDPDKQSPLIATGDPSVIDFEVVGPRQIRITGRRIGVTDLSIVTADNENYSFEVHVNVNLEYLDLQLKQIFPDAALELSQVQDHVVIGGQARNARQVAKIIETVTAYLTSVQSSQATKIRSTQSAGRSDAARPSPSPAGPDSSNPMARTEILPVTERPDVEFQVPTPVVINLIRVPGPGQVLLRVQVAELNRTAARTLGTSLLFQGDNFAVGSTPGPTIPLVQTTTATTGATTTTGTLGGLLGLINPLIAGTPSTVFGIFDGGGANAFVTALRRNQVLKILAEPNLVAMNGEQATFLSGGEFPVPVPQPSAAGVGLVTIQYKTFGVSLSFVPFIMDDETIRLSVAPEVSSIDFTTGVVIQGTSVPGINTRRTSTVVEMRQNQTLAISGILQVTLDGTANRIPGLGDLPYIGALFRNTTTQTVEKELIILVTPYLVQPMEAEQVPVRPGDEIIDPDDCEFFWKGRIEGRECSGYRATLGWDDPLGVEHRRKLEGQFVSGPYGYSQ